MVPIEIVLRKTSNMILDTSILIVYFMNEKLSIIPLLDKYIFNKN